MREEKRERVMDGTKKGREEGGTKSSEGGTWEERKGEEGGKLSFFKRRGKKGNRKSEGEKVGVESYSGERDQPPWKKSAVSRPVFC